MMTAITSLLKTFSTKDLLAELKRRGADAGQLYNRLEEIVGCINEDAASLKDAAEYANAEAALQAWENGIDATSDANDITAHVVAGCMDIACEARLVPKDFPTYDDRTSLMPGRADAAAVYNDAVFLTAASSSGKNLRMLQSMHVSSKRVADALRFGFISARLP